MTIKYRFGSQKIEEFTIVLRSWNIAMDQIQNECNKWMQFFTLWIVNIVSGSEDTNLWIWKAEASKSIVPLNKRQKEKIAYSNALKWKFAHNSEIKRIIRHKHVPKLIKK